MIALADLENPKPLTPNPKPRSMMALADLKNSDFSVTPWMHSMYSANLPVCAGDAQKIYLVI
jgi:hypothetical protein